MGKSSIVNRVFGGEVILVVAALAVGCSSSEKGAPATATTAPEVIAPTTKPAAATAEPAAPEPVAPEPVAPEPVAPEPVTDESLIAAEMTAYEAARPVFDEHCGGCHMPKPNKQSKAVPHFSMGSYPFGGHHAAEIALTIRESLGVGGAEATMPKDDPGSLSRDELEFILAWADAFDAARAAGAGHHDRSTTDDDHGGHDHGGHDHGGHGHGGHRH